MAVVVQNLFLCPLRVQPGLVLYPKIRTVANCELHRVAQITNFPTRVNRGKVWLQCGKRIFTVRTFLFAERHDTLQIPQIVRTNLIDFLLRTLTEKFLYG